MKTDINLMNNLNKYISEMAKSMEDKLWFIQFLKMPFLKNAVVYDYGCADGTLIRHLAPLFPDMDFVGVDNSEEMFDLANSKKQYTNEHYNQYPLKDSNRPSVLILSSVFHEIFNYLDNPEGILRAILIDIDPDYIFFRDMIPNDSINRNSNPEDVKKVDDSSNPLMIEKFEYLNGRLSNQRNLVHYLLKYRYKENWEREVYENYFACTIEELPKYFTNYGIVYSKHYTLPFIKNKVKEDFDIDLMDNTHINIIFKKH